MTACNILNHFFVILPEMISEDGKLIFKELILPENFKYRNPNDWTLNSFLNRLYWISKTNIGDHDKMFSYALGLQGEDPYETECLEESLESIVENPRGLILEIMDAIQIRIIELGHNSNIYYSLTSDFNCTWLSKMMVYNGKNVSNETLKRLGIYLYIIYYLNRNKEPTIFQKNYGGVIDKIKAAGVPTKNCISWALEMISNE